MSKERSKYERLKYDRLEIALEHLTKALGEQSSSNRRKQVLLALWNLIQWIAGRQRIPMRNAISDDEDNKKYCDLCFRWKKQPMKFETIDHMDVCNICIDRLQKNNKHRKNEPNTDERIKKEELQTIRVQTELEQISSSRAATREASKSIKVKYRDHSKSGPKKIRVCNICNGSKRIDNTLPNATTPYRVCPHCRPF